MHSHVGVRTILAALLAQASWVERNVHHALTGDSLVLSERTDRFLIDRTVLEVRIAGVFDVSNRRATAWRDYLDPACI